MKTKIALSIITIAFPSLGVAQTNTFPSSGNVGIGTTAPGAKLDVNDGHIRVDEDYGIQFSRSYPNDHGWIQVSGDGSDTVMRYHGHYGHRFSTSLGDKLSILRDGNVGIGTISPAAKFEVEKPWGSGGPNDIAAFFGGRIANGGRYNTYITGHTIAVGYGDSTDTAGLWINWQGYQGGHSHYRDFFLGNGKGASVLMSDGSSGNIGIGTATPDHRLDVKGTIRAEEVIVETGWSDFVFEPEYTLRSLEEVELYIEEKGHLPDVPPAATIGSEGLSVGETQKIMMQKIEELTLYVIDMNKEVKALRSENSHLKTELSQLRSSSN